MFDIAEGEQRTGRGHGCEPDLLGRLGHEAGFCKMAIRHQISQFGQLNMPERLVDPPAGLIEQTQFDEQARHLDKVFRIVLDCSQQHAPLTFEVDRPAQKAFRPERRIQWGQVVRVQQFGFVVGARKSRAHRFAPP